MAEEKIWKGLKDLEKGLVEIDLIDEAEDNENEHPAHQIKLLSEVLADKGQQRPMNVLPTDDGRFVTNTGHAMLRAAKLNGWSHISVVRFEGSEDEASAYRIADNMLGRLSTINPIKVGRTAIKLESRLPRFDASTLGMEPQKLKKITEALKSEKPDVPSPGGGEGFGVGGGPSSGNDDEKDEKKSEPTLRYELFFESENEREKWFAFLRKLRDEYPDIVSPAGRVLKFIENGSKPEEVVDIGGEGRVGDGYFVLSFDGKDEADDFDEMAEWLSKHYGETPTKSLLALFKEATGSSEEVKGDG
jgi:hypothetical protein